MADKFKPQLEWNLPLSGAVTMPITMPSFTGGSMSGGQIGLFNIDLGNSSDPVSYTHLQALAQVLGPVPR